MQADQLRQALRTFVDASNPDARHQGLARDTRDGGQDREFLSTTEEYEEVEKFVAWYTRSIAVGDQVRVSRAPYGGQGAPYTGKVVAVLDGRLVVELASTYPELPSELCWRGESGTIFWACAPTQIERIA